MQLSEELQTYGYVFDMKKSIFQYAAAVLGSLVLGVYFSLSGWYLLVLCIWVILLLPFFLRNLYKNRYEQQRFSDVNIYMEQFLYSFQKSGKILETLEDVMLLFEDGQMRRILEEASAHIRSSYENNAPEEEACRMIEQAYPAYQIRVMHGLALQVEKNGGDYSQSVLLMLEMRRMWADRVYELLNGRRHHRTQVLLSICTSLLLCSLITLLSNSLKVEIAAMEITHIVTLLVLMSDFYIYYLADKKLSADFLKDDEKQEQEALRQYQRFMEMKPSAWGNFRKKILAKNITRELEKEFPKWLMQIALLLQSENVQVAIFKSYEDAPKLLKPALRQMIRELKREPDRIEPYLYFLKEFTLPEVRSSMKMLYSLSEGTGGDAAFQIADIIRRNQKLMDKAQKLKNEDSLAGMYALFLAPQLTGSGKILVDLLVLMVGYLTSYGSSVM